MSDGRVAELRILSGEHAEGPRGDGLGHPRLHRLVVGPEDTLEGDVHDSLQ